MNKYIKSDIREGLNKLRIGLGNLFLTIARGEIEQYESNIPINTDIIASVLDGFTDDIEFIMSVDNKDTYLIYLEEPVEIIVEQSKDKCLFYKK
jgi:hypothetical protein